MGWMIGIPFFKSRFSSEEGHPRAHTQKCGVRDGGCVCFLHATRWDMKQGRVWVGIGCWSARFFLWFCVLCWGVACRYVVVGSSREMEYASNNEVLWVLVWTFDSLLG